MMLRVVFMGSPDFAVPTLEAVIAAGHDVAAVYTQPPRPAGRRGLATTPSPVHRYADGHAIPVETPTSLRTPEAVERFQAHGADIGVVVAYGMILPQAILDAPRHGCFNLHASALPRWRGAAPIHRAIMAGDQQTAAMVMRMEAGLDTGPIVLADHVDIGPNQTTGALHDVLAARGAALMVEALAAIEAGNITPTSQAEDGVTYAAKIAKAESRIDVTQSAEAVHNHIRGLAPAPGAWFEASGGGRVKVLASLIAARPEAYRDAVPGTLVGAPLVIACGTGAVSLEQVQRAGKTPVDAQAYVNGQGLAIGDRVMIGDD
ncbi:MAG: methionyl-tRNA formyltransferase [Pseudomonadota bacterium]